MNYLIVALALLAAGAALAVRRVGPEEQLVIHRFGKVGRSAGPGLALVVPVVERARWVDTRPRHRWIATTTRTADGASAHIRIECVLRVTDARLAPEHVEVAVHDAVEERLHQHVAERSVRDLPAVGQVMDWAPDSFVPGVLVENAEVTVRDVEMSGDLRALMRAARRPSKTDADAQT